MSKILYCNECGNSFHGRYDQFTCGDFNGNCPDCGGDDVDNINEEKLFEKQMGFDSGDYASLRDTISTEEQAENYPGKLNELIQKNNWSGSLKDYTIINRVGGQDHNPKFNVKIELQGISAEAEGYFSKKDCLHVAALSWWEKAPKEIKATGNGYGNQTKIDTKNVPFSEKLNTLKRQGIVTKLVDRAEGHLIHAAYHDFVNKLFTNAEIKNKYNL